MKVLLILALFTFAASEEAEEDKRESDISFPPTFIPTPPEPTEIAIDPTPVHPDHTDFPDYVTDYFTEGPDYVVDYFTDEPDYGTDEPDWATEEPDWWTEEPDWFTEEPDWFTEEPDWFTEEPDYVTEAPETDGPGIGCLVIPFLRVLKTEMMTEARLIRVAPPTAVKAIVVRRLRVMASALFELRDLVQLRHLKHMGVDVVDHPMPNFHQMIAKREIGHIVDELHFLLNHPNVLVHVLSYHAHEIEAMAHQAMDTDPRQLQHFAAMMLTHEAHFGFEFALEQIDREFDCEVAPPHPPRPTWHPRPRPTGGPRPKPTGGPRPRPSRGPRPRPSRGPRPRPSRGPRPRPTWHPRPRPSGRPRPRPTGGPRPRPSWRPRPRPTGKPEPKPTGAPRPKPTGKPRPKPTGKPRPKPTGKPRPSRGPKPTWKPRPRPSRRPRPSKGPQPSGTTPPGH